MIDRWMCKYKRKNTFGWIIQDLNKPVIHNRFNQSINQSNHTTIHPSFLSCFQVFQFDNPAPSRLLGPWSAYFHPFTPPWSWSSYFHPFTPPLYLVILLPYIHTSLVLGHLISIHSHLHGPWSSYFHPFTPPWSLVILLTSIRASLVLGHLISIHSRLLGPWSSYFHPFTPPWSLVILLPSIHVSLVLGQLTSVHSRLLPPSLIHFLLFIFYLFSIL